MEDQARAEMETRRVAAASIWSWRKPTQVRPVSSRAREGGGSEARASLPMQESLYRSLGKQHGIVNICCIGLEARGRSNLRGVSDVIADSAG